MAENPEDQVIAVQGDNLEVSTSLERSECKFSSVVDDFLIMTSLRAPEYANDERAPVDLCVVIDRSGSMSGPRLRLALETCNFVVDQLDGSDRLAIVAYDNEVDTFLEFRSMCDAGKEMARAAINSIQARGSTNLCGGLCRGIDLMRVAEVIKDVRSVLLFTDGQANCGPTSASDIVRAMTLPQAVFGAPPVQQAPQQKIRSSFFGKKKKQAKKQASVPPPPPQQGFVVPPQAAHVPLPCTVNAFGYGENHDANLLQAIAEAGQGIYYFVESADVIADAFGDCLGGLLSSVAKNIRIRFEALNGVRIKRVLSKYAVEERQAGTDFILTLPDLQSEEMRDLIIETTLPALDEPVDEWDAVRITLTYRNLITDSQVEEVRTIHVRRSEIETANAPKNIKVDEQHNRWLAADAMERSNQAAARGEMEQARLAVQVAQLRIEKSPSANNEYSTNLVGDLKKCSSGLKDRQQWQAQGSKYMNCQMRSHQMQRSSNINDMAQESYGYHSKAKKSMARKFKK